MSRPLKTVEELRAAANIRAKRWQQKQRASGKKHISGMIDPDVYDLICRERDRTGTTLATILETAVIEKYGTTALMEKDDSNNQK